MVILLQLLGQFCVLYLPIKRGKAAEETVAFSTHRGKHRVSAAGSGTGKPQPNKQVRKKDPSQGHGAQYVCLSLHYFDAFITLMPPHQKPDDVQATSRGLYTK